MCGCVFAIHYSRDLIPDCVSMTMSLSVLSLARLFPPAHGMACVRKCRQKQGCTAFYAQAEKRGGCGRVSIFMISLRLMNHATSNHLTHRALPRLSVMETTCGPADSVCLPTNGTNPSALYIPSLVMSRRSVDPLAGKSHTLTETESVILSVRWERESRFFPSRGTRTESTHSSAIGTHSLCPFCVSGVFLLCYERDIGT